MDKQHGSHDEMISSGGSSTESIYLLPFWQSIAKHLERIADALAPPPQPVADSPYVAGRLGCTTGRVAQMARSGEIPPSCIVAGTGDGKPWKFNRRKIDEWIESR